MTSVLTLFSFSSSQARPQQQPHQETPGDHRRPQLPDRTELAQQPAGGFQRGSLPVHPPADPAGPGHQSEPAAVPSRSVLPAQRTSEPQAGQQPAGVFAVSRRAALKAAVFIRGQ